MAHPISCSPEVTCRTRPRRDGSPRALPAQFAEGDRLLATVVADQSCAEVAMRKAALPAWERGLISPPAAASSLGFGLAEQLQDVLRGRVGNAQRLNGELLLGLQGL